MQPRDPASVIDKPAPATVEEPADGAAESWVLFTVDDQIYALDLWEVERIVRAVEVKPLPEVPPYIRGVVDVRGRVLPVVDLRVRLGGKSRPISPEDHFIIGRTATHSVVIPVDSAVGSQVIAGAAIPPDSDLPRCVRKVVPLEMGVVYSLDLQRVLFGDDPPFDTQLSRVLAELQRT